MAFPPRLLAFAALGLAPALLMTGCGEDATGARTTLGTVQNTSYVVEDPVTTTTTSTVPAVVPEGEISPNEQIHIVVAGDSLSKIASQYGITLDALVNYNAWPEGINHLILPGHEVKIPPNAKVPSAAPATAAPAAGETPATETTAASGAGCTHTVVANDNPTRVAAKYDITVEELAAANANNPAYQHFQLGSQLTIPANGSC